LREEYLSVGWHDDCQQAQVHDHLQVLDGAKQLVHGSAQEQIAEELECRCGTQCGSGCSTSFRDLSTYYRVKLVGHVVLEVLVNADELAGWVSEVFELNDKRVSVDHGRDIAWVFEI